MRGYNKIISCLLALSMLVGCWKNNPTKVSDFKVQIKEMNLDGAKAMAHLQSGNSGTKASMEFEQEDALYLVYDNNEIRLPEIKFTVEAPDSWSEFDKKRWLDAIHVDINDPMIKDFGEYIYVYSSLSYYIDGNGVLDMSMSPQQGVLEPGQMPNCPHSNTIIRKKDGICLTVDDNIGVLLYWASSVVKDSMGQVYFTSFSGSSSKMCRLSDVNGEIEVRSVDMPTSEYNFLAIPLLMLQECNGDIYVAQSCRCFDSETGESKPLTQLSKVSSDLTFDIMYLEGLLLEFERYGDDAFLFVGDEAEFKVYNAAGGELVASVSVEGGRGRGHLLPVVDGIYMYYYQGIVIRYDAQSGTCTSSELNETIRGYFSSDIWSGWNYYTIYSPSEERSVEVLKINILEETVESLKKLEVPEGSFFKDGGLVLEDESEGKLLLYAVFFANGEVVEEINMQIIDPEIAQAYADAKAKEHYGVDFGSYKVVNVVPLDDDLASSQN